MPGGNSQPPPRQSPRGKPLYSILTDGTRYDVEIWDDTKIGAGVELQLYRDGVFAFSRWYTTLEEASREGLHVRDILQRGWRNKP